MSSLESYYTLFCTHTWGWPKSPCWRCSWRHMTFLLYGYISNQGMMYHQRCFRQISMVLLLKKKNHVWVEPTWLCSNMRLSQGRACPPAGMLLYKQAVERKQRKEWTTLYISHSHPLALCSRPILLGTLLINNWTAFLWHVTLRVLCKQSWAFWRNLPTTFQTEAAGVPERE